MPFALLTSLGCLLATALARSNPRLETTPGSNRLEDEAAIRALIASETEAFNRGDAQALAQRFQSDGTFTNTMGVTVVGQYEFEQLHTDIFATIHKGSVLRQKIRRLHFVRPDVAVVNIDAEVTGYTRLPAGIRTEPDRALRTRLLQVLVKENGEWWIAALHNVDLKPLPGRP